MKKKLTLIGIIVGIVTLIAGGFTAGYLIKHHNLKEVGTIIRNKLPAYYCVRYEYKYNNLIHYEKNVYETIGTAVTITRDIDNNLIICSVYDFKVIYKSACNCHKTLTTKENFIDYTYKLTDTNFLDYL